LAFGSVADRFGRRAIFTYALLLYSVSAVMMACQTTAHGLNFWRLMTGIGLGVELVTIDAYLSELVPVRIRGRAFAVSKVIAFAAVPCVALVAYLLVPYEPLGIDGWRWVCAIGASGALVVWLIRLRLPESPRWLANHGQLDKALAVIEQLEAKVRAETGKALPEPAPAQLVPATAPTRFAELWSAQFRARTCMLVVFHAAQGIALYGFSNWMPTFLIEQGVGLSNSLQYGVLISCVAPFGPLLAMSFADRVERKWQIVVAACIVAVAGMVFVEMRSTASILLVGAIVTLGSTVISLGFHTYQAELFPTRNRAMAIGFVYSISRLSGAASGFLIAAALKQGGVAGALALISGCMLVGMLVIGFFGPHTRGRSLEQLSQ
ncbi:MAG: MFS transporter, partial [Pseudomonas sp.]